MAVASVDFIFPDMHFPEQDELAVEVFEACVAKYKPRRIIGLGDILQCEAFKGHATRSFAESKAAEFAESELRPANAFLRRISKRCELVLIEGNHDAWPERMAASNGALRSVWPLIDPKTHLSAGIDRFTWVPYNEKPLLSHFKIAPDLWAVHGWSHGKHAADVHLSKVSNFSIVFGHVHRRCEARKKDPATDKPIYAWSPGCLSKLQQLWTRCDPTEWSHGFSMVIHSDDGNWTHYTVDIKGNWAVLPNGKEVVV